MTRLLNWSTTTSGCGVEAAGSGNIELKLTNRSGNEGWIVGVKVDERIDTVLLSAAYRQSGTLTPLRAALPRPKQLFQPGTPVGLARLDHIVRREHRYAGR